MKRLIFILMALLSYGILRAETLKSRREHCIRF